MTSISSELKIGDYLLAGLVVSNQCQLSWGRCDNRPTPGDELHRLWCHQHTVLDGYSKSSMFCPSWGKFTVNLNNWLLFWLQIISVTRTSHLKVNSFGILRGIHLSPWTYSARHEQTIISPQSIEVPTTLRIFPAFMDCHSMLWKFHTSF